MIFMTDFSGHKLDSGEFAEIFQQANFALARSKNLNSIHENQKNIAAARRKFSFICENFNQIMMFQVIYFFMTIPKKDDFFMTFSNSFTQFLLFQ